MLIPLHLHGPYLTDRALRLAAAAGALSALAGLLVGFQGVVRDAVRQGELRREATARHSAATWRCTALHSLRQRDDCLAQLNAAAPEVTLLPATARPDVSAMTQDNRTR